MVWWNDEVTQRAIHDAVAAVLHRYKPYTEPSIAYPSSADSRLGRPRSRTMGIRSSTLRIRLASAAHLSHSSSIRLHARRARSKLVYIDTCATSQNEILAAAEKVTGQKWTVNKVESSQLIKNAVDGIASGDYGMANMGLVVLSVALMDSDYFGGK